MTDKNQSEPTLGQYVHLVRLSTQKYHGTVELVMSSSPVL